MQRKPTKKLYQPKQPKNKEDLISKNVEVKVCGTCMARCGIYKNHPYFEGAEKSTMPTLAEWVIDSEV